jgi:hypothetical protein
MTLILNVGMVVGTKLTTSLENMFCWPTSHNLSGNVFKFVFLSHIFYCSCTQYHY